MSASLPYSTKTCGSQHRAQAACPNTDDYGGWCSREQRLEVATGLARVYMSDDVALLLSLLQGHLCLTACVLCYGINWAHSVAIWLGLLDVCSPGISTVEGLEVARQTIRFLSAWTNFSVEKQATPVKMYWMPFLEKWFRSHISEWPKLILMLPSLLTEDMKMLCHGFVFSWIVGRIIFFFLQLFLPWLFLSLPSSCSWTLVLEVKVQLWHARVCKGTFSSASNFKKLQEDLFSCIC